LRCTLQDPGCNACRAWQSWGTAHAAHNMAISYECARLGDITAYDFLFLM
jgi:hypothetical protein